MSRALLRKGLLWAALTLIGSAITATAEAGWRHWGWYGPPVLGWTGYNYSFAATPWIGAGCCDYGVLRPAYVPVSTVCCDPCWGTVYRRPCLLSRVNYRWNAHHWNYYWGWRAPLWSMTCCPSCGCTLADCCCGSTTGDVLYGEPSIIHEGAPATPTPATPTPAVPPAEGEQGLPTPAQQTSVEAASALLSVQVPADARVRVNGIPTRSTGELRRYVSRDLAPGFRYTYEVTAEVERNGQPVTQTKTVHLRAGEEIALAFDLSAGSAVETALTLHVPGDAKVFLAGNETKGTGPVRTFRTTKLAGGDAWSEYSVRVTVERGGEQLEKEERITLRGGERAELTFDFDVDKIAAAR
jgi:uncharacterized protein (TIGR03000 family)